MKLVSLISDVDRVTARFVGWPVAYSRAAKLEGWNIFECFGSNYGPWQIQAAGDGPLEGDDDQAFSIVTSASKPHHRYALAYLERHNPLELETIEKWMARKS